MKTQFVPKEKIEHKWMLVNADGQILGRLATKVAHVLQGKHKPIYEPHADTGDFVIVINAEKIRVTGKKMTDKMYKHWTGYPDGLRERPLQEVMAKKPDFVIRTAVRRMLPKTDLGRHMLRKLKIYAGAEHPHAAQQPVEMKA
jgi:large subunit ribosomal protein L13